MRIIKSKKSKHITCRRCGSKSYKINKKYCVSCNFGKSAKLKNKNKIKC